MTGAGGALITCHRGGFGVGFTPITPTDRPDQASGIALGVLRLAVGERHRTTLAGETALLLMAGTVSGTLGPREFAFQRQSLFDERPSCLHGGAGSTLELMAATAVEFTVYACANASPLPPRVFGPADVVDEARGAGLVGDRALRLVRTIFDAGNSVPAADLVLGEVITLPGGWSSYPPHHHPQPEIYHYRFTHPQGFGHAELGQAVFQVRQYDTLLIGPGLDHAQCAAPGYGMYYSWVIRHLPGCRYTVPEFAPEHRWSLQADAPYWRPATAVPGWPPEDR